MRKMIPLSSLHNSRTHQPAAVLGGGPSLPADVSRLPEGALLIAANDHALHVGIQPDVMVINDLPSCKPQLLQAVMTFAGMRFSQHTEYSDVELDVDYWCELSGMTAAWLALFMGCDPVLLCGMDLYQGEAKYCHDQPERADKAIYKRTLEQHLKHWRKVYEHCPHPERIRAVSGPLVDVFGEYARMD